MNDKPNPKSNTPDRLDFFSLLQCKIVGVDERILVNECPQDIGTIKAVAALSLAALIYMTTVFGLISSSLFGEAGRPNFGLLIASAGLGLFFLFIDSFVFRGSWLAIGLAAIAKLPGLEDALPEDMRRTNRIFIAIRVGLSTCLALVVGTCLSVMIYNKDITARLDATYLESNSALARQVSAQVDDEIARATDAVNAEIAQIKTLTRQVASLRQNEVSGTRRSTGSAGGVGPATGPQVRAFETRLAAENSKLSNLKEDLARLMRGRNAAIRAGIDSAPNHVRYNDGIIARIGALGQAMNEDGKVIALVVLVEIIAVGLDLAALTAKLMGFCPTAYSLIIACRYVLRNEQVINAMFHSTPSQRDDFQNGAKAGSKPANDNRPGHRHANGIGSFSNDNEPAHPKRKRGRPKNPPTNGEIA